MTLCRTYFWPQLLLVAVAAAGVIGSVRGTELFQLLDTNGNGAVNLLEMRRALRSEGEAKAKLRAHGVELEPAALLTAADLDGNKILDPGELQQRLAAADHAATQAPRPVAPPPARPPPPQRSPHENQHSQQCESLNGDSDTCGGDTPAMHLPDAETPPARVEDGLRPPSTAVHGEPLPLRAEQVAEYLGRGLLPLHVPATELPDSFHSAVYNKTLQVWEASGRRIGAGLGNNIVPAVSEIAQLLETPTLRGALGSLLGPGYAFHPHRFLHTSSSSDQDWHKDSMWGMRRMRSHYPKWLMLLYYPRPPTLPDGPTAVLPGTQFWTVDHETRQVGVAGYGEDRLDQAGSASGVYRSTKLADRDHALDAALGHLEIPPANAEGCGKAGAPRAWCEPWRPTPEFITGSSGAPGGTLVLMDYDVFHRGSRADPRAPAAAPRCLFKLQFMRTAEPTGSDASSAAGEANTAGPLLHPRSSTHVLPQQAATVLEPVLQTVLEYLAATQHASGRLPVSSLGRKDQLRCIAVLAAERLAKEPERVECGYRLGRQGRSVDPTHEGVLRPAGEMALAQLEATLRSSRSEALRRAAMYGLAAAGGPGLAVLIRLIQQEHLAWPGYQVATDRMAALSRITHMCHGLSESLAAMPADGVELLSATVAGLTAVGWPPAGGSARATNELRLTRVSCISAIGAAGARAAVGETVILMTPLFLCLSPLKRLLQVEGGAAQ